MKLLALLFAACLVCVGCQREKNDDSVLKQTIVQPKEKAKEAVRDVQKRHVDELNAVPEDEGGEVEDDGEDDTESGEDSE